MGIIEATVYDGSGSSVKVSLDITPSSVSLFDCDGDLCGTWPVPCSTAPDPLEQAEKARRAAPPDSVAVAGDPAFEALAGVLKLLHPLSPLDRRATLQYLRERFWLV